MKKIFTTILIGFIFCFFMQINQSFAFENSTYKVIKVIDGDCKITCTNRKANFQSQKKLSKKNL